MKIRVYWHILRMAWSNGLVYRTSLFLWRIRQLIASIMALTIWNVIYATNTQFGSYGHDQMITYIFVVAVLQNIILASILNGLASAIYAGNITHHLLKPINLFGFLAAQDLADKLKNFGFIVIESLLLFYLFKPHLIWPEFGTLLIVVLLIILATILNFIISLLFGAVGFWSPDSWAPRFLFYMIIEYSTGRLYPLDVLPKTFQQLIFLTPFPYLSFVQSQIFLGRFDQTRIALAIILTCGWIGVLGVINHFVWRRGLKDYTAAGQ